MTIQTFKQNGIVVDVSDLAVSNKKSAIHVLHVDDDPSLQEITKLMLLDLDSSFEIDHACCVDEAFGKLAVGHYDVVVSDYEMPKKNGLQFLTELREAKNDVPFILFTGKGREEVSIKALNLGADGYYNKQGPPETVYGELAHAIQQSVEHKKTGETLRESEYLTQKMLFCSPNLIYIYDLQKHCNVYANREVVNFLGYTSEQVQAMGSELFNHILHPDDVEVIARHHARFANAPDNTTFDVDYRMKHASGEWRLLRSRDTLFARTKEGIGSQILGTSEDITEQKKAEEALRESEERFRTIFEGASEGIMAADIKTKRLVFANSAMSELVGYSLKELCMLGVDDIHPKEDLPYVVDEFTKLTERKKVLASDIPVLRKDGKVVYCDITSKVSRFGKDEYLVGFFRDISERKSAEETMAFSERRYREFADSLPEIVFEADDKGMPTFLNKKAFEIMGYSSDEIKQMNILQFLVPEDRQRARENIQRRMQGEKTVGNEYTITRKDGTTFPAIIFTEKTVDSEGKPSGLRGVIVNISQTKRTAQDLQLLNEKLRVVGSLTRHDVTNKLMTAKSNLYLLKKQISDRPELTKYLDGIDSALASSDKLFEFSRLYERIGAERPSKENVFECFNQAAALSHNLGMVKVVNECRGLEVVADSLLIELLYNFIDNSLKHGEKVTQIRLNYTKEVDRLKLFYEDDGVGVPLENKPNLFEEGFSTGGSTGFGLFLTKKMIEVYGWQIQETGEPGTGAKFTITIPKLNQNGKENYYLT